MTLSYAHGSRLALINFHSHERPLSGPRRGARALEGLHGAPGGGVKPWPALRGRCHGCAAAWRTTPVAEILTLGMSDRCLGADWRGSLLPHTRLVSFSWQRAATLHSVWRSPARSDSLTSAVGQARHTDTGVGGVSRRWVKGFRLSGSVSGNRRNCIWLYISNAFPV